MTSINELIFSEKFAMPNNPLFYPLSDQVKAGDFRDQVQLALAIADVTMLKSLLVNCIPPIAEQRHLKTISTEVGVPTDHQQAADGILHIEVIKCVPADPPQPVELKPGTGGWTRESRELARLTRHESEMQTLGQNLALAPTISLLAESGFTPKQVEDILRLPHDAWYKSWWYAVDQNGNFTIPFLRHIRTLHYPDGTLTIQYRDFFEQEKPVCFAKLTQRVLVFIKPDGQGFGETLKQINYQRQTLGIYQAILICNTISELEARGCINQGISLYPAVELVLPTHSDCAHCGRKECVMNGRENSPVAMCYGFLPESEFV
jgi:bacterioferritin-associated ferredoxin